MAILAPILLLAIPLLGVLAIPWLRRPPRGRRAWPRTVTAILVSIEAWVVGFLLLLVTVYAFVAAFWGGGFPCMGGGCDPQGSDPTGIRGLIVAVVFGALAVGSAWLGTWAYRRRSPSAAGEVPG